MGPGITSEASATPRRTLDRILRVGIVLLSLAVWAPRWHFDPGGLGPYDEGNTVVAAWRLLHGEALYQDVWQIQASGTAYLLAGVFHFFGTTLTVERVLKSVLLALTAAVLYDILRRFVSSVPAAALSLLFAILTSHPAYLRPAVPALLCVLAALLLTLRSWEVAGDRANAVGAGLAAGAAALFRHDFGAYVLVAIVVGFAVASGVRDRRRRIALVVLGCGVVLGPALAALAAQGVLRDAYDQTIVFAATRYVETRRLPLVDPIGGAMMLGPIVAGLGLMISRRFRGRARAIDEAALLVGMCGLLVFNSARFRADPEHLGPTAAFAIPLCAYLAAQILDARALRTRPSARTLVWLMLTAAGLVLTIPKIAWHAAGFRARIAAKAEVRGALPPAHAAGWIAFPPDLAALISELDARIASGVPLFVGNERHDRILVNHTLLYFLADRPGVTRYYNLHPGLATTREVQQEIVRALQAKATPFVVTWAGPIWDEPNATASSSGVTDLDDFLRDRYRAVARFGAFTLRELSQGSVGSAFRLR